MRALLNFLIFNAFLIALATCREVCYGELGCFVDSSPFSGTVQRPIAVLPNTPEKIDTKFKLYNRANPSAGIKITYQAIPKEFDSSLRTVMVVHGFLDNEPKPWMFDIKNAVLNADNVNVIIVDWTKGNQFPYTQATANTQVVGAEMARLINALIASKGVKANDFHLVGHSLGAHISGYVGSRVKNLGRITGLDPAGPYFENTDPIVRLDPTDALYVDAIHTDGASTLQIGFGLMQAVGHADFYPNGGKYQPECKGASDKLLGAVFNLVSFDMNGVEDSLGCNHMAAIYYFIESIKNNVCRYNSFQCGSKEEFDNGNCLVCTSKGCNKMGYWSSASKDRGTLYLHTLSPNKNTYCTESYKVKLTSGNLYSSAKGTFKLYMKTSTISTAVQVIDDVNATFKPDTVESRVVSYGDNSRIRGTIESVFVSYSRTGNIFTQWFYDSQWNFKSIEVFSGDDQITVGKFCPTSNVIGSDFVEFKRC